LDDMAFARSQELATECLTGTRESVITDITEWIQRPPLDPEQEQYVYWLHGVAGCGKSAIASTIAQKLQDIERTVWFFFNASNQAEVGPGHMFSTLSRALADADIGWRRALVEIASESREVRTTPNVKKQFEKFLLQTAEVCKPVGPILVVIDALDESGSKEKRAQLLQMIGRLNELRAHGHFRFLITSRPEHDIRGAFEGKSWVLSRDLTKVDTSSTDDDIRRYIESELLNHPLLSQEWPDQLWISLIVSRANHLFQWASVACKFIKGGVNPVQRYTDLCNDRSDAQLGELDGLYKTVLQSLYHDKDLPLFRTVLGRVLCAREPLSIEALTKLQWDGEKPYEIEVILRPLGSLLKGVDSSKEPIQPLHTSFIDFLQDPSRSDAFHIVSGSEDKVFAKSCLRVMNNLLKFNICHLKSSYVRNRDIVNLESRINENIPEHLSYACRYFGDHLSGLGDDEDLEALIGSFLYRKFLFWLEVLSLLGDTYPALKEMLELQTWTKVRQSDHSGGQNTNNSYRSTFKMMS
jgi:hypothetical protein